MTKHTAPPWKAGGITGFEVRQQNGRMIADFGPHHTPLAEYPKQCADEDRANAQFAVRAATIPEICSRSLFCVPPDCGNA